MRGMMGQDGESKDEVFTVKTRFKLLDASVPVKQFALQRDGMMFGGGAVSKLLDENGREFKPVGGFGFDAVKARRTADAILLGEKPEATDVLTFESTAGAIGDLTSKCPRIPAATAGRQVPPAEGTGTFRFRLPPPMWGGPPPSAVQAGPGNWATVGPVSIAVDRCAVGKVKIDPFRPAGPRRSQSRRTTSSQ